MVLAPISGRITAPTLSEPIALTADAKSRQQRLVDLGKQITDVNDAASQAIAVKFCQLGKTEIAEVEEDRKVTSSPYLKRQREIKSFADEYVSPIAEETNRVAKLISNFQDAEEKRVAAEAQRQAAEAARLDDERRRADELARVARAAAESAIAAEEAGKLQEKENSDAIAQEEPNGPSEAELAIMAAEMAEDAAEAKQAQLCAAVAVPEPRVARAPGMIISDKIFWEIENEAQVFATHPHFFKLVPLAAVIRATVYEGFVCPGMRVWAETGTGFKRLK